MSECSPGKHVRTLSALADAIVPEAQHLPERQRQDLFLIVETLLSAKPKRMQRQFSLFLYAIHALCILRYGRFLTRLSSDRLSQILTDLETSPFLLLRRGTWGLRTLIFVGFYGRPEGAAAIGYQAQPDGWSARRSPA